MKLVLLIVITVASNGCSDAANKFAGPFDIIIKEPTRCDDEGTREIYFNESTVRKKSRTLFTVTTNIINSISFSDELTVRVSFSVWGNGGWRPNYMTLEFKNACTTLGEILPDVFQQMLADTNRTSCPIPAGSYRVVDVNASPRITFPTLPYNKYKILFLFRSKEGLLFGCSGLITDIVPKENKRG